MSSPTRLREPEAAERVRRAWRGPRAASPRQRWLLYRRQRGKCAWCRQPLGWPVEAHHVRAWRDGGRTRLRNLVLLHRSCHRAPATAQLVNSARAAA